MDHIVSLVTSLSPVEKQHFKRRHDAESDFVLLFDYINRNKSCLSKEVLPYLNKQRVAKKKFTSSYLSVVKAYLKDRILESLRIQFIHKRKNYELLSRSMNSDILLEKGLFSLAKKEIDISTKTNIENSFPIERLLLLRRKSILDYYENYNNTNLDGIESLFKARESSAEQLLLEIKFARILSILSYQFFKGINDTVLLESFMAKPFMNDKSLATEFSTQYLFHWVHAQFQEFKKNDVGALAHFNISMQLWLDHPKFIEAHPRMYLGACFTYFKYLIHQKDPYSDILENINFDVLLLKLKDLYLSLEEQNTYQTLFQLAEILSLRKLRKFEEMVQLIPSDIIQNEFLNDLSNFEKVIYCYNCALANLECGHKEKAEQMLHNLLNPADHRLANNPVYIAVYLMLHLVILFESGNKKYIRLLLPKYRSYLLKESKLNTFESNFIKMISQLTADRYVSNQDLVYDRFLQRLTHAPENEQRGLAIEYDYFISWVQKKKEAEKDLY